MRQVHHSVNYFPANGVCGIPELDFPADDVTEPVPVFGEVVHQCGKVVPGNIWLANYVVRVCDMDIVTHPNVGVAALRLVFLFRKTCGRKQTVRQSEKFEGPDLLKERMDRLDFSQGIGRLYHARNTLACDMERVFFHLRKTMLLAGPDLPDRP